LLYSAMGKGSVGINETIYVLILILHEVSCRVSGICLVPRMTRHSYQIGDHLDFIRRSEINLRCL